MSRAGTSLSFAAWPRIILTARFSFGRRPANVPHERHAAFVVTLISMSEGTRTTTAPVTTSPLSWFARPAIQRHVESHLIWGPVSRHVPAPAVLCTGAILLSIGWIYSHPRTLASLPGNAFSIAIWAYVGWYLRRCARTEVAGIGWLMTKLFLGLPAFMLVVIGAPILFSQASPDAPIVLALGLVWLPAAEFIRPLSSYQRWITAARFALTIPLVILGIRTGCWTW